MDLTGEGPCVAWPNLAARLGRLFARDGGLWLRMQIALDLWEAERDEDAKKVKPLPAA